ncbi:MAG: Inner membrane protein YbaN [uncultured Sphingomonas sp.]|uniref:Inner membrane protein YbaN n=1 Tax=uncultured Sphingomonas sp. TaxID=158754 RepID=A0A6J4T1P0_9SPHN|nr:YbaN family protein [uncultured Sphingomonas sp.]CAA9511177.1 MAG: Inner membrane protein YbaN [uncultured Sphingomonas sp.]
MKRGLLFAAGLVALALGFIGIVVPLLPTVAFWILAAWCFARSSPRLEAWLLYHPRAGPSIRAWRERGAIGRRGKLAASAALLLSSGVGFATLEPPLTFVPVLVCAGAAAFIWTRPD